MFDLSPREMTPAERRAFVAGVDAAVSAMQCYVAFRQAAAEHAAQLIDNFSARNGLPRENPARAQLRFQLKLIADFEAEIERVRDPARWLGVTLLG